jgi:uncharacterized OB-fold protein
MTPTQAPPGPRYNDWNRPYFEAAAAGRLELQHCDRCGQVIYYPRFACPGCLSNELTYKPVDGKGTVYSFSVVWRPKHEVFDQLVPIILVAVQLDGGGPMIIATLDDLGADAVEIGMPVEASFRAIEGGVPLLRFRPA